MSTKKSTTTTSVPKLFVQHTRVNANMEGGEDVSIVDVETGAEVLACKLFVGENGGRVVRVPDTEENRAIIQYITAEDAKARKASAALAASEGRTDDPAMLSPEDRGIYNNLLAEKWTFLGGLDLKLSTGEFCTRDRRKDQPGSFGFSMFRASTQEALQKQEVVAF